MLTIVALEVNKRHMGEIWRNKGKYKLLQEITRLNIISWDFGCPFLVISFDFFDRI
jgi:hypothetical protein